MLNDAISHTPPAVGTPAELEEILTHRRNLRSGYGLPVRHTEPANTPAAVAVMGQIEQSRACGEDFCQTITKPRITGEACA
jgi:hypothetical protein